MNSTIRRVVRDVKRWRGQPMVARWVALGVAEAAKKLRRVKGHARMPTLIAALRPAKAVEGEEKVA